MNFSLFNKIPKLRSIEGYEEVCIVECHEKLVVVNETNKLKIANIYYNNNIPGSINESYVRQTVLEMLIEASNLLPDNYFLYLNDGWRPHGVQLKIYEMMFMKIKKMYPDFSDKELHLEASKYASIGSLDPLKPSPHFTGGSVDVTLVDEKGQEYYMGTNFDDSVLESSTSFFEIKNLNKMRLTIYEKEALKNRRLLFNIMRKAGFTNYSNEWWHYDYGNQLWGRINNVKAIYGLIKP